MRLRVVPVLVTVATVLAATPAPTEAGASTSAPAPIVRTDPTGDVHLTQARGISAGDRRTIDLERLRIVRGERITRFTVVLQRVARNPRFTQYFAITLMSPGYDFTQLVVATHPDGSGEPHGIAHYVVTEGTDTPEGYVECDHLRTSLRGGADRWSVDVPRRCLPRGPVRIDLYAQTTPVNGGPQYSSDGLRVSGSPSVGGTLPPAY